MSVTACGKKEEQAAAPAPPAKPAGAAAGGPPPGLPVKAVQVKLGEVRSELTAVGSLLADEAVIIRPEIDGRVVAIHFDEGQRDRKSVV